MPSKKIISKNIVCYSVAFRQKEGLYETEYFKSYEDAYFFFDVCKNAILNQELKNKTVAIKEKIS